jgi:hypothetical protein
MASHLNHDTLHEDPPQVENIEAESEPDDEVDQLDSESDVDVSELDMTMKNGTGSGERMPGHSIIPALRLENIIQADGKFYVVSSLYLVQEAAGVAGNLSVSKEGLFILSIATVSNSQLTSLLFILNHRLKEEFIKRMAEAGHLQASSERRTSINYRDMGESKFDLYSSLLNCCRQRQRLNNIKNSCFLMVCTTAVPCPNANDDKSQFRHYPSSSSASRGSCIARSKGKGTFRR